MVDKEEIFNIIIRSKISRQIKINSSQLITYNRSESIIQSLEIICNQINLSTILDTIYIQFDEFITFVDLNTWIYMLYNLNY